jgi:hypothetical protein
LSTLEHCWSIWTGSCLITLFFLREEVVCYHSTSTVMRNWWKVSKHDWVHTSQTSLMQTYKNLTNICRNLRTLTIICRNLRTQQISVLVLLCTS